MVLRRVVQLLVGLFFYGVGLAMLVRSMLGAAPWDVLTLGVSNHVPLSFGMVIILVSVVVLLCWIPLRERPGLGTVLNALLVGPAADFALLMIPEVSALWVRVLLMIAGVTMVGLATGLYIGARFGPGPRDGLMTGLHRVTGKPIWVVRTGIEIIVVTLGWLLGGVFGIGTVVFALAIGPLCQFFIPLFDVEPRPRPHPEPAEASAVNVRGRAQ